MMPTLRIAVVGRAGQVAQALIRAAGARGIDLTARGRPELDLASVDSAGRYLHEIKPDVVVNAAAYTAVDKAESEPELAFKANTGGPALLATLCDHFQIPLIHLSTDYVFDGSKRTPYLEDDPIAPLGTYGASKSAGEAVVRSIQPRHVILRTAWVYAPDGANFLKTMLRLGAERDALRVVDDQRGSPTSADDIAGAVLDIARRLAEGVPGTALGTYHLTNSGETTWYGFAAEIFRLAAAAGMKTPRLEAIPTSEYPTPARRPQFSVLDNAKIERVFSVRLGPWQQSLARCFEQLVSRG